MAGVLWVGLVFVSLAIATLSPLFMMVSDGCGGSSYDDAVICGPQGSVMFFGGLALLWLLLLVGVLYSGVKVVSAAAAGSPAWPWPFAGAGIGLLGIVLFIIDLAILTN